MNCIKKLMTVMFCALACGTATAQWNTTKTPFTIYDCTDKGDYYICTPHFARTTNGKTWMAYKIWLKDENDNTCVSTYVQLLDQDGNKVFDDLGIRLNSYPTDTWWSEFGAEVDPDGNFIVSVADARGTEAPADGHYRDFVPAVYKINQEGDMLWGLDGIALTDFRHAPYTNVFINGDKTYFQFTQTDGDNVGTYTCRIGSDGTVEVDPVYLYGQMVPSVGSDMLCFSATGEGPCVQRYNSNLEAVWEEPIVYDTLAYGGYDLRPYKIASDGEGGAAVTWICNMGMFAHNVRAQYITADGDLGFGLAAKYLYNKEEYDHDYCGITINTDTKEIMVDWEDQLEDYTVSVSKLNYGGDYLWGETGIQTESKDGSNAFQYTRIGSGSLKSGDWILACANDAAWNNATIIVKRLDTDGNVLWRKVLGRALGITRPTTFVEEDFTYIFWRDDAKEALMGIRISNADGTFTGIDATQAADKASTDIKDIYTIDGKRLSEPQKGLNIVRYADGTIGKKFVK